MRLNCNNKRGRQQPPALYTQGTTMENELAAEKKANAAPDKAKLLSLAARIDAIEMPTLAADEGQRIIAQTRELLAKVTAYIRTNSDKL